MKKMLSPLLALPTAFALLFASTVHAQISIVAHASVPGEIGVRTSYGQDFNLLANTAPGSSAPWEDNRTLPGWYAATGPVGRTTTPLRALITGATGPANPSGILFSMAQHFDTLNNNSPIATWRALGAMPAATDTPVTLGLRLHNQTKQTLSGLRVSWETKWAYTGSLDAKGKPLPAPSTHSVTLRWRKFAAGQGTLAHSPNGWNDIASAKINNHDTSIPDCWNHFNERLTGLHVAAGEELWLAWEITRLSGAPAVVALDNVRVTDFADASPFITRQPLSQSVPFGAAAELDVEASGLGDLAYQWLSDGVAIPGANSSTLRLPAPDRADDGTTLTCRVSSADGEVLSAPATLKVYFPSQVRGPALPSTFKFDTSGYAPDPALGDVAYLPAGRRETADLYLPDPLRANSPAVVIVHGGGGNNGDKRQSREAQAGIELARRGYVALSINYKMSAKKGVSWPRNVQDAFHAVRWLRANAAKFSIDADNIGAIGFSWGCNTVAMLSVIRSTDTFEGERLDGVIPGDASTLPQFSSSVQAVAAYYGAVDPGNYHQMNMHGATTMADDAPARYFAASPVNFVHAGAAPTYLSHGTADTDVLMTQLFTLRDRLRDVGAEVTLHLVPHGEHSYGLYDTTRIAKSAPPGYVIDERPRLFGFLDHHLHNAAPTLSVPGQSTSPAPAFQALPKAPAAAQTAPCLPAIEAAISSSAPTENIGEAAQGYLSVKHSAALTASRKAYFQFTITAHPTGNPTPRPARFTVAVAANFRQRVQLWALDQNAPDFSAAATWKDAPANDPASNGLLRTGPLTASPLGEPQLVPSSAGAALVFTLTDWAHFVHGGKITLVLTGVEDAANNKGGLRLAPASARFIIEDAPTPALPPL
jgi:acetyl esterase/lipase